MAREATFLLKSKKMFTKKNINGTELSKLLIKSRSKNFYKKKQQQKMEKEQELCLACIVDNMVTMKGI